jgi:5'(3')-deoxyribonucleotidase
MKCLLDLDGLLVDFCKGAHAYHNIPYSTGDSYPYPKGFWDIDTLLPISQDDFWKPFGYDFWANLPWMEDGQQILQLVERLFGVENICICSCPPQDPNAVGGKIEWVKKNIPQYSRRCIITPRKEFCAHSNVVLIDDRDKNIDTFIENGGHGILVPRLWNRNWPHTANAVWHIQEGIYRLHSAGH